MSIINYLGIFGWLVCFLVGVALINFNENSSQRFLGALISCLSVVMVALIINFS